MGADVTGTHTPIDIGELAFEPPGPGTWQVNGTHVPRPWPHFQTALYSEQIANGFREMGRRYGLLADFQMPFVHGFAYFSLVPVTAEEVPQRFAAADAAFERKLWRADFERWQTEAKPAAVRAHLALQATDPGAMDQDSLAEHVDRSRAHLKRMIYQHHWFNGAALIPIGDLLAHAVEWTGRSVPELLPLLRGFSPVSAGHSRELDELLSAFAQDEDARALLTAAGEPREVLVRLRALPAPAGPAAAAYVDSVGYRLIDGHNVGETYALEQPGRLLAAIRRRVEEPPARVTAHEVAEQTALIRDQVPGPARDEFDALLEEARLTAPLRDERGVFSDVWAAGIARRALIEVGRRLERDGLVERADHVVEADYDELRRLMSGQRSPAARELAARAAFRDAYRAADAPLYLGPAPEAPPSLDGLPPATARVMRAVRLTIGQVFQPSDAPSADRVVRGLGASPGVYSGRARRVDWPSDFGRIDDGDVLVTQCTSEAFNLLLPLLGAIVTDAGGYLSHPAIVAREFGIPAVVGSLDATQLIADGARVRVDGGAGEVVVTG